MPRSEAIGQLAAALAKAQGQTKGAIKDAQNPFFKSHYSDLGSIIDAMRKPFSDNSLAYVQLARSTEDGVEVETVLMHESGQWISETLSLPVAKHDAQGIGSAITYAKRYSLQAMAGIPSEDDDGHAASKSMKEAPPRQVAKPTPNQFELAIIELAKVGITREQFVERLKKEGHTAYVHKRDAQLVDDLIMQKREADLLAHDDEPAYEEAGA